MKSPKLIRLTFAGVLLAGLSTTLPSLRAQDGGGAYTSGGGCGGCHWDKNAQPTPSTSGGGSTNTPSTNAPTGN